VRAPSPHPVDSQKNFAVSTTSVLWDILAVTPIQVERTTEGFVESKLWVILAETCK